MLRASKANQIKLKNQDKGLSDTNEVFIKKGLFCENVRKTVTKLLENFTGHQLDKIKNFNDFVEFMYVPVDAASIGVGRMLFGKSQFSNKKKMSG